MLQTKQLPEEELAPVLQKISSEGYNLVPRLTTPILDAVLAAPPQGWDAKLLRRLTNLAWQTHLLNRVVSDMHYWLRATRTVPDHQHGVAVENHARSLESFKQSARATLKVVRQVLELITA